MSKKEIEQICECCRTNNKTAKSLHYCNNCKIEIQKITSEATRNANDCYLNHIEKKKVKDAFDLIKGYFPSRTHTKVDADYSLSKISHIIKIKEKELELKING